MSNPTVFVYEPVGMDLFYDHSVELRPGEFVVKTQPHGCPRNGTMGQTYVAKLDGTFVGLRNTKSLRRARKAELTEAGVR